MKKAIQYFLCFLLLVFFACDRDIEEPEGPSIADLFGEFSVLADFEVEKDAISLENNESTSFSAQFSKTVDWELEILGKTTGAQKIITGTSSFLDASNATWNGSATTIPIFNNETCYTRLRVNSEDYEILDSVKATGARTHEGFLVADFENGFNDGWNGFAQSGADMTFIITDEIPAGQGNNYYDMGGAVDWDYLIGLIDFPATAFETGSFGLPENPDNLFFNVFLYKPAGITNEIVLFQFREDENQDGSFTSSDEDLYAYELTNLEVGWQQISVKYSDLVTLVNGQPSTPAGNGIHDPSKLHQISVLMLADPESGYSQVLMDYMIFTENNALQP